MLKKVITSALIALFILFSGCSNTSEMTAEGFFKSYLNIDSLPPGISNFSGKGEDRFPVFLSRGFFKYEADPSYFDFLLEYDKFFETSETNQKIHIIKCDEVPQDILTEEEANDKNINTQNKVCYKGVFVPYIHYILYDPNTHLVYHFIMGTRG
jgi:hypothetical protein